MKYLVAHKEEIDGIRRAATRIEMHQLPEHGATFMEGFVPDREAINNEIALIVAYANAML